MKRIVLLLLKNLDKLFRDFDAWKYSWEIRNWESFELGQPDVYFAIGTKDLYTGSDWVTIKDPDEFTEPEDENSVNHDNLEVGDVNIAVHSHDPIEIKVRVRVRDHVEDSTEPEWICFYDFKEGQLTFRNISHRNYGIIIQRDGKLYQFDEKGELHEWD